MVERFSRWLARNAPKREELAQSRWMKPFGQRVLHSEFWRLTRRSVPRGVAVGLWVGIFALIPGIQIIGSALLSIPFRANIPIAAAMTFLSNPLTTPLFLYAAIDLGGRIGFHTDLASFTALRGKSVGVWLQWLWSDAAPAVVTGLFLIGLGVALVGYSVSLVVWRWWVGRKWRQRFARPN